MRKKIILPIMIFLVIFMIGIASSVEIYVKPQDRYGRNIPLTTFSYVFNFTTNSNCSGVVLSYSSSSVTTGVDGIAYIGAVNLDGVSGNPLYICEYKNDVYRVTHTLSDFVTRDIYARNANLSGYINVTGNASANYFIGDGSKLSGIIISESDPSWTANYTAYNDSWTTTDLEIWGVAGNGTLFLSLDYVPHDQDLNTTNNVQFANLTLGQKITFAFNEVIDNLVNGWIRITGSLNVTENAEVGGNVTANYFVGSGSKLTGIDVTDIWVNESGDTMSGNLNMSDNNITDVSYLKLTNTTTVWDIYVDVNGTIVWKQE